MPDPVNVMAGASKTYFQLLRKIFFWLNTSNPPSYLYLDDIAQPGDKS